MSENKIELIDWEHLETLDQKEALQYLIELIERYGAVYYRAFHFLESTENMIAERAINGEQPSSALKVTQAILQQLTEEVDDDEGF
jgi:hypothetical protein